MLLLFWKRRNLVKKKNGMFFSYNPYCDLFLVMILFIQLMMIQFDANSVPCEAHLFWPFCTL